ncbi:kinesin-related protein 4-like [Chironomus tepperi]|uniref:kinesin-related protein 4-like n=1 Tax=Chironomus tepperi TaxID=113505 RepID=UPI00391F7D7F
MKLAKFVDSKTFRYQHAKNQAFGNYQVLSAANVFDEFSTNHDVYSLCAQNVLKSLDGYNGTILTYGQTSSGKTFTMMGDNNTKGIVEMAIDDIFDKLNDKNFILRVGFIEIYNEKIYDLLDKSRKEIKIFDYKGQLETNQNEFIVKSKEEILKYVKIGNRNKQVAATMLNEFSSRSHTIFSISIDITDTMGETKSSKLIFGDLAGSEKPDITKNSYNEGLHINKSLLALGKIIRELSKPNANMKNVRFRESLLTRLLASSLGGNSYTTIICTASPVCLEETFNTICFAQNAEKTKCKPISNSINDSAREVTILKSQVQKLQLELDFERSRISDNSIINFDTTYQVTHTVRRTESLKRKFCVDHQESICENPTKIFVQTDESAIEENKELIEELKKQVADFKTENENLKAQLTECNQNLDNLIHTKESLKHDLKEESHKGWKIKEKCKMLRNKLVRKKEKLSSMKANLIDTHDGLDKSQDENLKAQYESDLMHKNLIIFGLEKELKKFKDAVKNKQFVSCAVNTDADPFEVQKLEQEIYSQHQMIHDLNMRNQGLLYKNQMLQNQLDDAILKANDTIKERDEFKKMNNNMKMNFQESIRNSRKQLHDLIEQKQKQAIEFRKQLTKSRNEDVKNHLQLQEHYENQITAFKTTNRKLNARIEFLESELNAKNGSSSKKSKITDLSMYRDLILTRDQENEKIKFIKSRYERKLSETITYLERILNQKDMELNEIRKLQHIKESNNIIDKLVGVSIQ